MANSQNISTLLHTDCCGCRACGDACPVSCISFKEDNEGFIYPIVDEASCIQCGKCVKICPEFNPSFNKVAEEVTAAYAVAEADRQAGSSGGIFGLVARHIINNGGKVWGAAFDSNLQLKHVCATTVAELKPLMRSKYLQSDTSGCFRQIAGDLKAGILTLFCGTPCQCNALRNYTGNCDNLFLIDLICHGVPSQDLFDKSIKWLEEREHCHVTKFAFRSKYKGALHPQAFSYECTKNGRTETVNGLHYQFPFYFGFQKYITLRPSCYTCKWASSERCGDITLGDFWGIERIDPTLDPKAGVSEILANTDKGRNLLNAITESGVAWTQRFQYRQLVGNNGCLQEPTKLKPERVELFEDLRTKSFDEVVRSHLVSKRRWIFDMYYAMPGVLRKMIRKVMDKRMKYE
ncbi:MAG: Coenzyme F420 hydrogenase/dehydrogenase, beta subunit C-terminal domain [Muribaculaceae bacterium]|nr:Coenzyme F420 hydrogenase/dehydrogenase, beta subunit C-terminal domain [Muribaculaceae bacterium]